MHEAHNPLDIVEEWLQYAQDAGIPDHNAAAVATSDKTGMPNVRIVLIKEIDREGLLFYTNYASVKAQELNHNKGIALSVHWRTLKKQIRVRGSAEVLEAAKSDRYYHSRPLQSRYSAWASRQSQILESREKFEAEIAQIAKRHGDHPPRPEFWGGYRIVPSEIEFWTEVDFRRHDRFKWQRNPSGWTVSRLYP